MKDHTDYIPLFEQAGVTSEKQRRFCVAYFECDYNATEAVRRAGYNSKYPNRLANELVNKPNVKEAIRLITKDRSEGIKITHDYLLMKMKKALETAEVEGKLNEMIRASEILMKHMGMFVDRTEISGKDGEAIRVEQMREAQNAADDFASAMARLAKRSGTEEVSGDTKH